MAARGRRNKVRPDSPDLPGLLDEPPGALSNGDLWECVRADDSTDLPASLADVHLIECVLTGVDLTGRRITGLHCRDVVFASCDLSGALLDGADLRRVSLTGCRLTGVMLSAGTLADVVIADCVASLANFRAAHGSYLWIERTDLREADFSTAELAHSALLDCDLTQASFRDVRADGLALHGSTLDGVRGAASLTGARIGPDQVLPLGAALLAAMGVQMGDR